MNKEWDELFDASIGLAFSLKAFEVYRKSGTLSAEIRSIPGMRGRYHAYLDLVQGKVVSCYLTDQKGERHTVARELLMQLDEEKGPFGWVFHSGTDTMPAVSTQTETLKQPESLRQSGTLKQSETLKQPESLRQSGTLKQSGSLRHSDSLGQAGTLRQPTHTLPRFPVRLVTQLDLRRMQQWTYQQQQYLHAIFSLVDGLRSVDEIKAQLAFPAVVVDEGIYVLLQLRAIAIQ